MAPSGGRRESRAIATRADQSERALPHRHGALAQSARSMPNVTVHVTDKHQHHTEQFFLEIFETFHCFEFYRYSAPSVVLYMCVKMSVEGESESYQL